MAVTQLPSGLYVAGQPVSSTNPLPVGGPGTAGTPAGGVISIQGVNNMTPVGTSDTANAFNVTFNIAVTTNPQTFTIGTLPLPLPEVGVYHMVVYQGASAQNITGLSLIFQDTIGTSTSVTYPIHAAGTQTLAQAASTAAHYYGILTAGVLKNVSLQVTWAGAPSAVTNGLVVALYLLDPEAVDKTQDYISQTAYLSLAATGDTQLIASPGAGLSIYAVSMEGSNASSTGTLATFKEGSGGTTRYNRFMAASGGGFVTNLGVSPWKVPANTGLYVGLGGANQCYFSANYYLAV